MELWQQSSAWPSARLHFVSSSGSAAPADLSIQAAKRWHCSCTSAILLFSPYVHLRQAIERVYGYLFATTAVKAPMSHYTENYFSFSVCVPDLDGFAVHRYRCHGNGRMVFLLISLHNWGSLRMFRSKDHFQSSAPQGVNVIQQKFCVWADVTLALPSSIKLWALLTSRLEHK